MRFITALILISLIITGCAPAKIYTFKKDRVDQDMSGGNRGYAEGPPSLAKTAGEAPQRTLIGVDFEIGLLPSEKKKLGELETKEKLPEVDLETTRKVFPPPAREEEEQVK